MTAAVEQPVTKSGTPELALSVADELAELLKLKEQDVLTQAEFDSQKNKLLNQ